MGQVLIGGGATLTGTFVVQVFVIPRVQRRTRRLERWEKDVMELAALLEEELPRALDAYKWATLGHRLTLEKQGDGDYDQEGVKELLLARQSEVRQANETVGQQMARLKILIDRAKRINADAQYWRRLDTRRIVLHFAMFDVEGPPYTDRYLGDKQWGEAWDKVKAACKQLLETVNEVAVPMKPPPRHIVRRLRQRIRRNLRATGPHDLMTGP